MRKCSVILIFITILGSAHILAEPKINVKNKIQQIKSKMAEPYDTTRDKGYWKRALQHGKIDINDTTIHYPSFLEFCAKVYRWGDQTFNSYDSTYVVSTGKNWKLMVKNNNWASSCNGHIADEDSRISMFSNLTSSFGGQISFMAVSLGYMMNLNDLFSGNKVKNKKLDLSFTCSRLHLSYYDYRADYPYYIHKFAQIPSSDIRGYKFRGMSQTQQGVNLYYIFNHRHYSQAAAYCFSKYQRKSSGSFIAGFHLFNENVTMNFNEIRVKFPDADIFDDLSYKYRGYSALIGYGYNWVLGKNWLFNITAVPGFGYRTTHPSSTEGSFDFWSCDYRAKIGLVLNRNKFFYGLHLFTEGHWYLTNRNSVFNANHDLNVVAGFRF